MAPTKVVINPIDKNRIVVMFINFDFILVLFEVKNILNETAITILMEFNQL